MRKLSFAALLPLLSLACAKPEPVRLRTAATPDAPETRAPREEALAVTGLRGTLSQQEIQRALEPRMPKFLRCAQERLGELDVLGGELEIQFFVGTDGSVDHVQPADSTLGDRETERCMLAVAKATRFPVPHGGEVEFRWPLELPVDSEVRPPIEMLPSPSTPPLSPGVEELHARCGGGTSVVTAYVAPTGEVLSAGVAAPALATENQLDCVVQGVRSFRFDSPGSYIGKLSFTVP